MPFHFAQARANDLTNDAGDSVTGTAEYKVCAVEVQPASKALTRADVVSAVGMEQGLSD